MAPSPPAVAPRTATRDTGEIDRAGTPKVGRVIPRTSQSTVDNSVGREVPYPPQSTATAQHAGARSGGIGRDMRPAATGGRLPSTPPSKDRIIQSTREHAPPLRIDELLAPPLDEPLALPAGDPRPPRPRREARDLVGDGLRVLVEVPAAEPCPAKHHRLARGMGRSNLTMGRVPLSCRRLRWLWPHRLRPTQERSGRFRLPWAPQ